MPGFFFPSPPEPMILNTAMLQDYIVAPHVNRCCVPGRWVFDYTITDLAHTLVRSEFSPWLSRPAGTGHLYPPGRIYEENFEKNTRIHSTYIIFSGENPVLRKLTENSDGFARISDPEQHFGTLLRKTALAASKGSLAYWDACSWFCRVLDLLGKLQPAGTPDYLYTLNPDQTETGSLGDRVKAYLEQHYRNILTVKEIARTLGVSESGLSHRYKEETGETIFETLLRIRVQQ